MIRRNVAAAVLAVMLMAPALARACPGCRESISNSDSRQASAVPAGFNLSIYYMLGSLGVVGGLVVRMIVRETRSADATHLP